jgi:hypothetical protein
MKQKANISIVKGIMTEFSDSTGLSTAEKSPRRYLWTEHQDINSVMLATSLAPDGYLQL